MMPSGTGSPDRVRVVVVMPAYNAARTLERTYRQIPLDLVDLVILVDDGSRDDTVAIATKLQIRHYVHERNLGYGANQKTCYREALREAADIIVMLHPDNQYDPQLLPELIRPITEGRADVVLGSRFLGESPLAQGMPAWRYLGNRALTCIENAVLGLRLSELHTGYRAFRREVLESTPYALNSDGFLFDQEIIAQIVIGGFRIDEVPVPTRYTADASSVGFMQSICYGIGVLWMLLRVSAHRRALIAQAWLSGVTIKGRAGNAIRDVDGLSTDTSATEIVTNTASGTGPDDRHQREVLSKK